MPSFSEVFGGGGTPNRHVHYLAQSQTVISRVQGWALIRCMGAAGSGARGTYPTGGSGGTVGVKKVRVNVGDSFVVTIPAGGAALSATGNGNAGGTLTITGPGVNITIPGGTGGVQGTGGARAALAGNPTGLDWYILGGRGGSVGGSSGATGGGSAALLGMRSYDTPNEPSNGINGGAGIGGTSATDAGGGSGGPASPSVGGVNLMGASTTANGLASESHSVLLINVSGGGGSSGSGSAGGSGGGGSGSGSGGGGDGGFGGGGGGGGGNSGFGGGGGAATDPYVSGKGGQGFVTIEFVEVLQ